MDVLPLEPYRLSSSFQGLKYRVVVYRPTEGKDEEREKFWNDIDRVVNRADNGCYVWVWSYGKNDNGRRVIDFCAERGLCVSNTYFKHKID